VSRSVGVVGPKIAGGSVASPRVIVSVGAVEVELLPDEADGLASALVKSAAHARELEQAMRPHLEAALEAERTFQSS
jgi:hypothetical protein